MIGLAGAKERGIGSRRAAKIETGTVFLGIVPSSGTWRAKDRRGRGAPRHPSAQGEEGTPPGAVAQASAARLRLRCTTRPIAATMVVAPWNLIRHPMRGSCQEAMPAQWTSHDDSRAG